MRDELFPREVISDVPRITLTGHERLHVEQHKGLVDYAADAIALRTACGLMRIDGAGMRFVTYTAAEAVILGRIDSIIFPGQGGAP